MNINNFPRYFDVYAKYRVKKSGSQKPSIKDRAKIKTEIINDYPLSNFDESNGKFYIVSNLQLEGKRMCIDDFEFLLKKIEKNKYEVRKLSNTKNANVIFNIKLKSEQKKDDITKFVDDLKW